MQAFIEAHLSKAAFLLFAYCLVHSLQGFLKFRSPECSKMHFRHSF